MKYSLSLRILHWLMAAMILGLVVIGFYMANIPSDAADKYDLYPLHKAFGFIILLMFVLRFISRLKGPLPQSPTGLANWEQRLSHFVHITLYLSMFSMAVSGFFMNSTYPHVQGLDIFGLFTVPDITDKSEYWNDITHTIHSVSAYVLSASLVLHLAGVIKHRYFDAQENDVLQRMI